MMTGVGPRNPIAECAHWRHLVNVIERLCAVAMSGSASATSGGDVTCCSLTTLENVVSLVILDDGRYSEN